MEKQSVYLKVAPPSHVLRLNKKLNYIPTGKENHSTEQVLTDGQIYVAANQDTGDHICVNESAG